MARQAVRRTNLFWHDRKPVEAFGAVPFFGLRAAVVLFGMIAFFVPTKTWGWGPVGHELVLQTSVDSLDDQIGEYFQTYLPYLKSHVMDPDLRKRFVEKEGRRHYFDVEEYTAVGFDGRSLPDTRLAKSGTLPWAILETHNNLTAALREREYERGAKMAADLAHYVGDMFQPLHTTNNHDGQLTGNKGIHKRYEIDLTEGYKQFLDVKVRPLALQRHALSDSIVAMVMTSHADVGAILEADRLSRQGTSDESAVYYRNLRESLMGEVSDCLSDAASFLAALYRLAWEEAGLNAPSDEYKALHLVGVAHE